MANSDDEIFNLERIRQVAELLKELDLSEIQVRQGEAELKVTRHAATEIRTASAPPPMTPSPPPSSPPAAESQNMAYIRSPMVGTFYSRPNPNAEPFVKVGDFVDPEKTICIIEAMKVFNEIPAEVRGRIVAILVEDEEAVEFGKPLFKIDTSGA